MGIYVFIYTIIGFVYLQGDMQILQLFNQHYNNYQNYNQQR